MKTLAFAIMTSSYFLGMLQYDLKVNLEEGKAVGYTFAVALFIVTCIIGVTE